MRRYHQAIPVNKWTITYRCHRAGKRNSLATRRRVLKKSKQIDCEATLKVEYRYSDPDHVWLLVLGSHNHVLGDSEDVIHLPLSDEFRAKMIDHINAGMTARDVYNSMQREADSLPNISVRDRHVNIKEIRNMIAKIHAANGIRLVAVTSPQEEDGVFAGNDSVQESEMNPPETRPPEMRPPETRLPETRPPETNLPKMRPPSTNPPPNPPEITPSQLSPSTITIIQDTIIQDLKRAHEGIRRLRCSGRTDELRQVSVHVKDLAEILDIELLPRNTKPQIQRRF